MMPPSATTYVQQNVLPVACYLLNTPCMPDTPMPSSTSLVSLKGTVSGVGRIQPCSKAIPIKTTAVLQWNMM